MNLANVTTAELQIANASVDVNNIDQLVAAIKAENEAYAAYIEKLLVNPGNEQQWGRGIGLIMAWLAAAIAVEPK